MTDPVFPRAGTARPSVWRVVAPFALVMALLAALGAASVDILSGVRAYVGGESLWSKGQRDGVLWLREYLQTGEESAYRRFELALTIPLGDREARLALERQPVDVEAARQGFLRGGNHPDDIDALIRLHRLFSRTPLMAGAIEMWGQGDEAIVQLRTLAAELHDRQASLDVFQRGELQKRIEEVSGKLDHLEQEFSARLGEASRWAARLLAGGTLGLAALLLGMGVLFARRTLTQLSASEAAARESAARWALATQAAAIGTLEWDLARDEFVLDQRSLALYGVPSDGTPFQRVPRAEIDARIVPEDLRLLGENSREAVRAKGASSTRYRVVDASGRIRHLQLHGHFDAQRVLGVVRDVTQEVQTEQLRLDVQTAERASAAKSDFLSRASHELRTPLNAIIGFAEMMQNDARSPLPQLHAQRLRHVVQGGNYLLKLVNDMLDIGGIEQGALPITLTDVDLADVIDATVGLLEPMHLASGVRITSRVAQGQACVHADATRLEQVFVNLIGNAIKFNRPGGSVTIDTIVAADRVFVEVQDTGIGMTPQQTAQLFQPFNRLGAEFSGVHGAGLGLVVSRQMIERIGGRIDVASEPGVGTRVRLELPRAAGAATGTPRHSALSA